MSIVERGRPCAIVDTSAVMSATLAASVAAHGYAGIVRYVPHAGGSGSGDISEAELSTILEAGLALMLVQHVRQPGWDPAKYSAVNDGGAAAVHARTAGYGSGAHIFLDLEGIARTGTARSTKEFAEAWAATILDGGYLAGAYVGYDVPLSAVELYELRGITSYWSDAGPRSVATRGFSIKQHGPVLIDGIPFDPDTVQPDKRGETPFWMR